MAKNKVIMAWSKCKIEIAASSEEETMPLSLTEIGKVKDKSTTLEAEDGETLEAKATGGEIIAEEELEGKYILKTRIIEPSDALYTTLGLGEADSQPEGTPDFKVKTHVVSGQFAMQVTPKNKGAKGIKAPLCSVKFRPGTSEEEGNYADLELSILKTSAGDWYSRFTTTSALK